MARYSKYDVTVLRETDRALLLEFEDYRQEWVPRSELDPGADITSESTIGDEGEVGLPEWIVNDRGL